MAADLKQNYCPNNLTVAQKPRRVIAIASFMGSIEAINKVVSALPENFSAAILLVQHLSPKYKSYLPQIVSRHTALAVREAAEGMSLEAGTIYVTPPDRF
ncbi:MAG: chemotaxis protein CheB [Cyanobacteria bacterium J06623_7]